MKRAISRAGSRVVLVSAYAGAAPDAAHMEAGRAQGALHLEAAPVRELQQVVLAACQYHPCMPLEMMNTTSTNHKGMSASSWHAMSDA